RRPALEENEQRLTLEQGSEERTEVDPALTAGQLEHLRTGVAQALDPFGIRVVAHRDQGTSSVIENAGGQRRPGQAVDDNAEWLPRCRPVANGQVRVVGQHGADADNDRV